MYRYYGNRSHATADLKRTAHAVRQRVDALPVAGNHNPRHARQVLRTSQHVPGQPIDTIPREDPYLAPRDRHNWAWRRR